MQVYSNKGGFLSSKDYFLDQCCDDTTSALANTMYSCHVYDYIAVGTYIQSMHG